MFDRHSNLKVISVEKDIGWVPNFMKRLEWYSNRFVLRYPDIKKNAATYRRDHVYYAFQDDEPGMRCRDLIGVDKMMWGSDYPHFDSTWPNSQEAIERNFAGVSDEEREMILGGNLVEVYGLQDILD